MILHQVEALAAAGVTDIVLAVNYRPEIMEKHLAEVGSAEKLWHIPTGVITNKHTVCEDIQRENHFLH